MSARETVLARKLRQGGVARSPLPETEVIGESFARLVEDGLRPTVATSVGAMLIETRVMKLSEATAAIGVPAMLALIEVEDADAQGLLCIESDLAYHLIDLMLGGDPGQAPAPTARSFTGIDMAVCRLPQTALLAAFTAAVGAITGRPITKRLGIGLQYQNVAQVRFAPPYVDVLLFRLALDIGEAARTGELTLLMPLATLDVIRVAADAAPRERPDDLWRIQMRRAAAGAPVVVDAVLHRPRLSLAAIRRLRPGDVIEVPESAVNEIQLTIAQPGAQPGGRTAAIASGHLGTYRGAKVVKLDLPVDARLQQHVRAAVS